MFFMSMLTRFSMFVTLGIFSNREPWSNLIRGFISTTWQQQQQQVQSAANACVLCISLTLPAYRATLRFECRSVSNAAAGAV
jgi:hypothetical protein